MVSRRGSEIALVWYILIKHNIYCTDVAQILSTEFGSVSEPMAQILGHEIASFPETEKPDSEVTLVRATLLVWLGFCTNCIGFGPRAGVLFSARKTRF